ncbi:MAG: helix-turn-helix transcriptional regulator [Candidatus Hydrogenedentes bacterium]|nr:helix-turn-helix transcriptional regulator [Candidatus Hydrogenedentota bacterium]
MQKPHWTATSSQDFLYRIANDFILQLENAMASTPISQAQLARKLGVSPGRVSQVINDPSNMTLKSMIEYARALGMKISIVAYDDEDEDNRLGPVNAEFFKMSWELCRKPRSIFDIEWLKLAGMNLEHVGEGRVSAVYEWTQTELTPKDIVQHEHYETIATATI